MNKITSIFICLIIGLISLFFGYLFINNLSIEVFEKLKVLSYILISFSVMVAIFQFKENLNQNKKISDWNKNQITIQQLHNSRKYLKEAASYLNDFLNTRRKEPYNIKEIHSLLGIVVNWDKLNDKEKYLLEDILKGHIQKDEDIYNAGSEDRNLRFIFYKDIKEESSSSLELIKRIILTDKELEERNLNDLYYHQTWKNYNGKVLYQQLHNFLGEYEYIATGVNNNIFNIEIIDDLMGTGIIQAYDTFSKYIGHLRKFHKPPSIPTSTVYIQFENLSRIIKNRRGVKKEANLY